MKKIKIMFVLSNLYPGGAQRTILNIANGLDKKKYIVFLILLKKTNNEVYVSNLNHEVKYEYLDVRASRGVFKLRRKIAQYEPNIVFSTLRHVNILTTLTHLTLIKKPKLVLRQSAYRNLKNFFTRIEDCFLYKVADYNIVLTQSDQNQILSKCSVKKNKVKIIHNPINEIFIDNSINESINFKFKNKLRLVAIGRLSPIKNHKMLIKTMNYFSTHFNQDFELLILGEGSLRSDIQNQISDLNLSDRIKLIGNVSNPYPYLREADIMLMTSISEGLPNAIIEAMYTKTLVISYDSPHGPKEILGDNKFGVIVEINDYIEMAKLINEFTINKERYDKLVEKGFSRSKDFFTKKILNDYNQLFMELLNEE